MADPPLAPLTHRPHPPSHGRAYAVHFRTGGFFSRDWVALVHRDGWAVPETCPAELLAQACQSGERGHPIECAVTRIDTVVPPAPPQLAFAGTPTFSTSSSTPIPLLDENAIRRIVRLDQLVRQCRHLPDDLFRRLAVSHLLELGLWRIPDLRAYDRDRDHLDPPGSWCSTVLHMLDLVPRTDPAPERAAQAYWTITSLEAHPPGNHAWQLTDPVPETDSI